MKIEFSFNSPNLLTELYLSHLGKFNLIKFSSFHQFSNTGEINIFESGINNLSKFEGP